MSVSDELNETSVQFLLTDADLALTFIQIAETSNDSRRVGQAVQDALTAYNMIRQKRGKFRLSDAQAQTLEGKLQQIRSGITQLGAIPD